MYDPGTVVTVKGEVTNIGKFTPSEGACCGIHLVLKTKNESISVHLGPSWYIDKQEVKMKAKDKVEITGSKVTFEGKPAIIAAEVKKKDGVLKLRDEDGIPYWAGWRRK